MKEFWHYGMEPQKVKYVQLSPWMHKMFSVSRLKIVAKKVYKLLRKKEIKVRLPYVNPKKSKAFMPSVASYGVYVKEASLIDSIISELKKIDGIEYIWKREEKYDGPLVQRAPHIMFLTDHDSGYTVGTTMVSSQIITKGVQYGHVMDGIILAHGDQVFPAWIGEAKTFDVVPTILAYLGLPVPFDTDGKFIPKIAITRKRRRGYDYSKHWQLIKQIQLQKSKLTP
jgi:hypothetical protein